MALDEAGFLVLLFTGITVGTLASCAVVKCICRSIGKCALGKLTYTEQDVIDHAKACAQISIVIENNPFQDKDHDTIKL